MIPPKIDLTPTPTSMADRKRTEILMEIEENDKGIPKAVRNLIDQQRTLSGLAAVIRKIRHEYTEGRLSDHLLKRCNAWVNRRLEELRPKEEKH